MKVYIFVLLIDIKVISDILKQQGQKECTQINIMEKDKEDKQSRQTPNVTLKSIR